MSVSGFRIGEGVRPCVCECVLLGGREWALRLVRGVVRVRVRVCAWLGVCEYF